MPLRPSAARWFEVVVPREDTDDAMEALARQGEVQFEWAGDLDPAGEIERLRDPVTRYRTIADAYAPHWPDPAFEKRCCELPVEAAAAAALRQIERWLADAGPLLARLAQLEAEREALALWRPVAASLAGTRVDPRTLATAGPVLAGYCLLLPAAAEVAGPAFALHAEARFGDRRALLGLARGSDLPALRERAEAVGGNLLPFPDCPTEPGADWVTSLDRRVADADREARRLEQEVRRLAAAHGLARASGVLERIDWFRQTSSRIQCDTESCRITGWTGAADEQALNRALRDVGVRGTLEFGEPPPDLPSPSVLRNPDWLKPFEVFTTAVGTPGSAEIDPTRWVAVLVPLMFGYMCGDVGHGILIVATGLLLRRRTDLWRLLVYCGLASIAFGFVYGEVFGYGHFLEPLWLSPLEAPFAVLVVPVIAGALVLSLGILLHAVQTCWRGQGSSELLADTAQLLVYWGLALVLLEPRLGWLVLAGVVLCAGNRLWSARSPTVLAAGLGELLQSTFELLLNTLSFARVGAFALAHAALESAIVIIAGDLSSTAAAALVLVVGNLLVILIEGMVVSVQTTRLVLYEFFVRFFEGGGRALKPVAAPTGDRTPRMGQRAARGQDRRGRQ